MGTIRTTRYSFILLLSSLLIFMSATSPGIAYAARAWSKPSSRALLSVPLARGSCCIARQDTRSLLFAHFTSATPRPSFIAGKITEYTIGPYGGPLGITTGPDGNLWFTVYYGNQIGKITPGGNVTEYPVPGDQNPVSITAGPDGKLWFTEFTDFSYDSSEQICRITAQGKITLYHNPYGNEAWGITAGPDRTLWLAMYGYPEDFSDYIGKMNLHGKISLYALPLDEDHPWYITPGPDGNLWFTEAGAEFDKIGRINPHTGQITEFSVPNREPVGITTGPDGNLWFTERGGNRIGRITPDGTITEFPLPTVNSQPWGITTGPDGNLWFTESNANAIGRITPGGTITEYLIPTPNSYPLEITRGPDGNLWFTEYNGDQIGKITPS